MRLRRNFFQQLKIVAHAAFYPARIFQQPIVKTLAATEPVAAQIKRHAWHENQIKLVQRDLRAARRRFAHAKFAGDDVRCQRLDYFCAVNLF